VRPLHRGFFCLAFIHISYEEILNSSAKLIKPIDFSKDLAINYFEVKWIILGECLAN